MSSSKVCHCAINFVGTPCTSGWLKAGFLFSYQKLVGTVQFSSDDMMLFLTFRPSLFAKICSCQREIQSHLTVARLDQICNFPWTCWKVSSLNGWEADTYKASPLRKVCSEAELCMRKRRRRSNDLYIMLMLFMYVCYEKWALLLKMSFFCIWVLKN